MLCLESIFIRLELLTIVLATSMDRILILLPLAEENRLLIFDLFNIVIGFVIPTE